MIVYNITIKVSHEIEKAWLLWQKEVYIPEILSTQYFTEYKFFKLLNVDESDGLTYVTQLFAEDLAHYNEFESKHAQALHAKTLAMWGNRFVYFSTIMQVVH